MNDTTKVRFGPLALGAAVGLGILFLIDPHHGETRRGQVKSNCGAFGLKCRSTWTAMFKRWGAQLTHTTSDFQAEIRAHAPKYLQ